MDRSERDHGKGPRSRGIPRQSTEALVRLADWGFNGAELLAMATTDAAALGLTDTGRLEPGRRADLLVLDRDPRSDITALRAPRLVLAGGVAVYPEAAASTDRAIPAGLSQVVADTVAETSR